MDALSFYDDDAMMMMMSAVMIYASASCRSENIPRIGWLEWAGVALCSWHVVVRASLQ